jgi:hypothetical protein
MLASLKLPTTEICFLSNFLITMRDLKYDVVIERILWTGSTMEHACSRGDFSHRSHSLTKIISLYHLSVWLYLRSGAYDGRMTCVTMRNNDILPLTTNTYLYMYLDTKICLDTSI